MKSSTSIRDAIKKWEAASGKKPEEETGKVPLNGIQPPIERMDEHLNVFENCTQLSLSSNQIDRMAALPKLRNLKILSLGRNAIKRIICLEEVGQTLEQLWISYNQIEKLDGLQPCTKLKVLWISNNKISQWPEVSKLANLNELNDVLLVGNPIYNDKDKDTNAAWVVKRVP